jgi:uncharacterized membrane protein YdbT with pleckstrin-like domain
MRYLENSLLKHEKIVFHGKPHWIIFSASLIWFLITFMLMAFIPKNSFTTSAIILDLSLVQIITLVTFLVAFLIGLSAYAAYLSTDFIITSKRVLMKTGFLRRTIIETLLSRVESIIIQQSILGRLCNFGSVAIAGANGARNPLLHVPQPLKFRHIIEEQIDTPVISELNNTENIYEKSQ